MGKIFTVLFLSLIIGLNAQTTAPKFINYQGVARDANGALITNAFDIRFVITNPTSTVHIETQTGIQPNAYGIFNTQIGSVTTLTPATWNNGPFTLNVSIKTGNIFVPVGSQQLVSVPFSLFAGDVPTSYTNNILTIGANSYNMSTASAATPTIYGTGLASVNPIAGNSFTVDVPAPTISFSTNGLTYNQGAVNILAPFNPTLSGDATGAISTTTVTALRNVPLSNITPTLGQSLFYNGSAWTPSSTPNATIAAAAWVKAASSVTLATNTDFVGIGTNTPGNKLTVLTSSASSAVFGNNVSGPNNTLSNGVTGKTDNANASASGVYGENTGNGFGVYGLSNLAASTNPVGVYGKTIGAGTSGIGVLGENNGAGPSVQGVNFSGSGSAVQGVNQANGIAVHGVKSPASTAGNAGRFENLSTTNTADAVFATSASAGAAVHAASSATLATSALALLLENGHVSTTAAAPTTSVITSLGAGGTLNLLSTSTDVAGRVLITFGTGPFTAGTYASISFNKPYSFAPIVILTPVTAAASTADVYVTSTTNGFTISHSSTPAGGAIHNFNYIVIETK